MKPEIVIYETVSCKSIYLYKMAQPFGIIVLMCHGNMDERLDLAELVEQTVEFEKVGYYGFITCERKI